MKLLSPALENKKQTNSDGAHYFYGYDKLHFSSCLWSIIPALTLSLNLQENMNPEIHNALTDL